MKQIIIIFSLLSANMLQAQNNFFKKNAALQLQVGHTKPLLAFKIQQIEPLHNTPINPNLMLSYYKIVPRKKWFEWHYGVNASYFKILYAESAIGIGANGGYQFNILKHFFVKQSLGGQYQRARFTDVQYEYIDGKWQSVKNTMPQQNRTVGFLQTQFGYSINNKIAISAIHQVSVATPYLKGVVPGTAYQNFNIGIQYRL
jgi:hypothetical protein